LHHLLWVLSSKLIIWSLLAVAAVLVVIEQQTISACQLLSL
jgi:hypothetical protein